MGAPGHGRCPSAAAQAEGLGILRAAGLSRESLYKALSGERSPDFDTILKVMGALGLKMHAEAPKADLTTGRPPDPRAARESAAAIPVGAMQSRRAVERDEPVRVEHPEHERARVVARGHVRLGGERRRGHQDDAALDVGQGRRVEAVGDVRVQAGVGLVPVVFSAQARGDPRRGAPEASRSPETMLISTPQLTPRDRTALDEFCRRTRAALGANLLEVRLFGSKARGEAVADSDLDVLLVVDQDRAAAEDRVLDLAFDVNLAYDVYISPRVVSHAVMVDPVWRLTGLLRAIERESVPL